MRWWGPDQHQAVLLASFAPYAAPAYGAFVVLLAVVVARARRRVLPAVGLGLALAGLAVHVAWLAPTFVADDGGAKGDGAGDGRDLVVATLNLRIGGAETASVARWMDEQDADVVVLTETTRVALAALEADDRVGPEGDGRWPYRAGRALPLAAGTVVLSQHPLGPVTEVPLGNFGYRTVVRTPVPFTLTAAHTAYPLLEVEPWRRDLRELQREAGAVEGPHLVVGDLNATTDHRALREVLEAGGLRDAAEQAGSGWQPTWPTPGEETAMGARVPAALLALDHVLATPGLEARETSTQPVPGTDHLALVAHLRVARTLAER